MSLRSPRMVAPCSTRCSARSETEKAHLVPLSRAIGIACVVVDTESYLLGQHSVTGGGPDGMPTRQGFKSQLIGLWLYVLRNLWRRRESIAPSVYLAFSIGPEELAVGVYELDVRSDEEARVKARPFFQDGLKRVEIWCGSRKVAEIPERPEAANGRLASNPP
jgi:hypothetical protein